MLKLYDEYLTKLKINSRYRELKQHNARLDFSTNDYLGLSKDLNVIQAGMRAAEKYGVGATGSRLLSGNFPLIEELEKQIAIHKRTEAALVFNSGFQTNLSTLSALLDNSALHTRPLVFFDMLNHSSLYQAVFLTKAELHRYKHNDMTDLERLLIEHKDDVRPKFIVTETVFGMDGDFVGLRKIIDLTHKHKALLYLDEAHATGVFGQNGYGMSTDFDLTNIPHVIMGTFSKAIGCSGGYIACSELLKNYIINKAAGFIYSTAPSPTIIGSALQAWNMIANMSVERDHLQALGNLLRGELSNHNFNFGMSKTHIVPIILQDAKCVMKIKKQLLSDGINVSAIRPPTVPMNSSRIRIAMTTSHTHKDILQLINALQKYI